MCKQIELGRRINSATTCLVVAELHYNLGGNIMISKKDLTTLFLIVLVPLIALCVGLLFFTAILGSTVVIGKFMKGYVIEEGIAFGFICAANFILLLSPLLLFASYLIYKKTIKFLQKKYNIQTANPFLLFIIGMLLFFIPLVIIF